MDSDSNEYNTQTLLNPKRGLLGKRIHLFSGRARHGTLKNAYVTHSGGIKQIKKLTDDDRAVIRKKIKNQFRFKNSVLCIALLLIVCIVSYGFVKLVTGNDSVAVSEEITRYEKEYLRYLERADVWIEYEKMATCN